MAEDTPVSRLESKTPYRSVVPPNQQREANSINDIPSNETTT